MNNTAFIIIPSLALIAGITAIILGLEIMGTTAIGASIGMIIIVIGTIVTAMSGLLFTHWPIDFVNQKKETERK